MVKKIEIQIGEEKAVAELLEDQAPNTCKAIWELLPCKANLVHSKIAGPEIYFKVPVFVEKENLTIKQKAGDVTLFDDGQCMCIYYDDLPGIGYANSFARITENLTGIRKEGLKGWKNQGVFIILRRKQDD